MRSPLTRVRSELEVDLAHPATADLPATHRSVLLVLARHDADPAPSASRVAVDLDDIVLHEIHRLRAVTDAHIDSRGVSAAQVDGDADQLARAIRNLLDNAARHAHDTVTVALAEHDGVATLTITDDGPGISPDHHEHIFERFSRVDGARTRDDGGTGLGLAIARTITERHNGTIHVDSHHHPGARFVVKLPTRPGVGTLLS